MIKQTLLTAGNAKIIKGEKLGYITKGIHFAPANLSGYEVCGSRSKGCTKACLNTSGRGQMDSIQDSRIAKTILFFKNKLPFMEKLTKEIALGIKSAIKKEMEAVFRPNLTSDLPWENIKDAEGQTLMQKFPATQFYDYTKHYSRMEKFINGEMPENYHLTFSLSEENEKDALKVLDIGGNVAVVFRDQIPETWKGFEVINGDENDLRFLDKQGGFIVVLSKKVSPRKTKRVSFKRG